MGTIGSAVAKQANGFGMKVLYHNRNRREVDEKQFGEILLFVYLHFSIQLLHIAQ